MWAAGHDASAGVDDVEATIRMLVEHGAVLDLKDDRGKTAADIAAASGASARRSFWSGRARAELERAPHKPAWYFAMAAICSGVTLFIKSDMPGLLARVRLRNSVIVLAR
jgi:hypothetical protein